MEFLSWLEASRVGLWVAESEWGYPVILTCHALGMVCVVGIVLAFDLRVLGYARLIPLQWFRTLLVPARIGAVLSIVSGLLLFSAAATRFIVKPAFLLKIALIIAGGIATWWLMRRYFAPDANGAGASAVTSAPERWVGALSIVFWLGSLVAGRLIAYT